MMEVISGAALTQGKGEKLKFIWAMFFIAFIWVTASVVSIGFFLRSLLIAALVLIVTLPLGLLAALSRKVAKIVLFTLPIAAFLFFLIGLLSFLFEEELQFELFAFLVIILLLVIFFAIILFPVAWLRWRMKENKFTLHLIIEAFLIGLAVYLLVGALVLWQMSASLIVDDFSSLRDK